MRLIQATLEENESLISPILSHEAGLQCRGIKNMPREPKSKVNPPLEAALCCGNLSLAQIIVSREGEVSGFEISAIMLAAAMTQDLSLLLKLISMFKLFCLTSRWGLQ